MKIDEDLDFELADINSNGGNRFEANDCENTSNDFGLESEMFQDEFDFDDDSLIHKITTNQDEITTNQDEINMNQNEITKKQDEQLNTRFQGKLSIVQTVFHSLLYVRESLKFQCILYYIVVELS